MSVRNTQATYSTNDTFDYKGKIVGGEFGSIAPVTPFLISSNRRSMSSNGKNSETKICKYRTLK